MRVLHVIDHTDRYNGMVHAAIDLACQQSIEGDEVSIWSCGGEMGEIARDSGVKLFVADHRLSFWKLTSILRHAIKSINTIKPDVIHAHMARSAIIFWFISKFSRIKLVTSVQNSPILSSVAMSIGDGVITGCEAIKHTMRRRGIASHKLYSVLNGTADTFRLMNNSSEDIHLERPALLTICGLHRRKGIDLLIRSFQECQHTLPDLKLYIIGDGPDRHQYEEFVAAKSIKNIYFCGYVKDTLPYMKSADAFILASLSDPAPLVISEARVAGMAVIATNVDGIPEMLDNWRAGMLIEANNKDAITQAICHIFKDEDTLAYWQQKSQSNITYMSIRRVSSQIRNVYEKILQE